MKVLVLDDSQERLVQFRRNLIGHNVTTVETASDCIAALNRETFSTVFLDHDLGGKTMVPSGEGTGYEVAEWLSKHPKHKPKQIFIHSFNPVGVANMRKLLPEAQYVPGAWSLIGQ